MVIIIVALMSLIFFLVFLFIYIKKCSASSTSPSSSSQVPQEILHKSTFIHSFPVMSYSAMKGLRPGCDPMECCVCLTEFDEHESLRMLPNCGHCFHSDCIDMWLYSHRSCPLCRQLLIHFVGDLSTEEARVDNPDEATELESSIPAASEVRIIIDELLTENDGDGERDSSRTTDQRLGERETALILSRNSQSCSRAAQDLVRMMQKSKFGSGSGCLRRSRSVGNSGRSLRKVVGLRSWQQEDGSRLQHAGSCSILVELMHQEVEGDKDLSGSQ